MTEEDIFKEVHTGPLGAQLLVDDSYIIEFEGWYQVVSPSRPEASRNEVIVSRLRGEEASAKVDEVMGFYTELGTSFKWVVGPGSKVGNFGDLLGKKGFRSWFGRGMYCFAKDADVGELPDNVTTEAVSEENLEIYVDLSIEGWGIHKKLREFLISDYLWALQQPDQRFKFHIARYNGEPAGTAGFVTKMKSAYLTGGNVLERYRGKGIYKALVKTRLDDIMSLGIELATSGAREKTSAPILERLGFRTAFRNEIFQYDLREQA